MKALLSPKPPRILRLAGSIFVAPFPGLWLVVLVYYALSYVLCPHSQLLAGNLPDPDDYMYLAQVIDWIHGQGWYDNIQHRLYPPAGTMIQFSRLAMIPMAALILPFRLFGMNMINAALAMAAIYPLLLFAGFLLTMKRIAAFFVPNAWTGASSYVVITSMSIVYMFQPGHIDHHGLIVWIVALALIGAFLMMREPGDLRRGLATGAILAVGMTVALEILPWILVIAGWIGLWALVEGGKAARQGLVFALAQFGVSVICLLLTRQPQNFLVIDALNYSVVYVVLTGGMAVSFAAVALTANARLPMRAIAGVATALICGGLFLWRFPDLMAGPYGAMDPYLISLILDEANEAKPLFGRIQPLYVLVAHVGATLLAIIASAWFLWRAAKPERWLWGLVFTMLLAGFGLTVFYEFRFAGVMEVPKIPALVALLYYGWRRAASMKPAGKFSLRLAVILLFAPVTGVILPYVTDPGSFGDSGLVWFPAASNDTTRCDQHALMTVLDDPAGLGAGSHTIVADTWMGPELLFRTHDSVIAAPFSMNGAGTLDAYRFFSTLVPEEAKTVMERRCVDLVLSCTVYPESYIRRHGAKEVHEFGQHFIQLLMNETPPAWLHEVDMPKVDNYYLYEVPPEARSTDKTCAPK